MKILSKVLLIFAFIFPLSAFCKISFNDSFHIKGKFIGTYDGYIFLRYPTKAGVRVWDSCLIKNGVFEFKGQVNFFTHDVYLRLDSKSTRYPEPNATQLYLENSKISISVTYNSFDKIKITGNKSEIILNAYYKKIEPMYPVIDSLERVIENNSLLPRIKKRNENLLQQYRNQPINSHIKFCNRNPNLNISPFILFQCKSKLSEEQLTKSFNQLSKQQQSSYYGININEEIQERIGMRNLVGKQAPPIVTTDINNDSIDLKKLYTEKYILLDFWASWCVPCRKNNPNLITLHKKYAEKGFQIIAIADDAGDSTDILKWKNAVAKDSTFIWINILRTGDKKNLSETNYDINDVYRVHFLPTQFLIDKTGKIIGRYEEEDNKPLESKLKAIFKF
jgi:thiol-disulfide isomerase/thioredoxin